MAGFGAALGMAAGSSGGSALTSGLQQIAASAQQYKRQKTVLRHRYQWMKEDLEKAGFNPILAMQSPPPAVSVPIGGFPGKGADIATSAKSLTKLKPEMEILRNQATITGHQRDRAFHDANAAMWSARSAYATSEMDLSRVPAAKAQETLDRTEIGEKMRWLNRFIRSVTGRDQTTAR